MKGASSFIAVSNSNSDLDFVEEFSMMYLYVLLYSKGSLK